MKIMQGDSYPLELELLRGETLVDGSVDAVEITVGTLTKLYPGEVTYSDGAFYFPLTQQETLNMRPGRLTVYVRLKDAGVWGQRVEDSVEVVTGGSREVL